MILWVSWLRSMVLVGEMVGDERQRVDQVAELVQ